MDTKTDADVPDTADAQAASLQLQCVTACPHCPDVVEWCPFVGCQDILAYGTYEHDEASGKRLGALHISSVSRTSEAGEDSKYRLKPLAEVEMPGVYDIAWAPCTREYNSSGLLAIANADGRLRLLRFGEQVGLSLEADSSMKESAIDAALTSCQLVDNGILTHVAWGAGGPSSLAAVGQDGAAHHVTVREDCSIVQLARWQAHSLETWCVEVSSAVGGPAGPHLVFTGADDSCIFGWDLREPPDAAPALANRKSHEAGVTALSCSTLDGNILASGSYDERIRLFDLRTGLHRPLAESQRLGDGAYHLAWHPCWPGTLAVAAMRSGLPLFCSGADHALNEWTRYAAEAPEGSHGSLAYGVSWRASEVNGTWLAASASFYDKSVHVWSVHCSSPGVGSE